MGFGVARPADVFDDERWPAVSGGTRLFGTGGVGDAGSGARWNVILFDESADAFGRRV